jgi:hypothetical protein
VHDPDRSSCDAAEEDGQWYAHFWEARRKQEQGDSLTPFTAPKSSNEALQRFTKRDVVLQTLLSRCEGTSAKVKQTINSWVSKYDFSKETVEAAEADDAEEARNKAAAQKAKVSSPKKKKQVEAKQPSRASPRKSRASSPKKVKPSAAILENDGAMAANTATAATHGAYPASFRRKNARHETEIDNSGNAAQDSKKAKKDCSRRASAPAANSGRVLLEKQEHGSSPKKSSSECIIGRKSAVVPKRKSLPLQKSSAAKKSPKLNSGVPASPMQVEEPIDLCDSD